MASPHLHDLPSEALDRLEVVVRSFEDAWQQGRRPKIDAFLPEAAGERRAVLIELIHVDLECRLRAGQPVRVEHYLKKYPKLRSESALVIELLAKEMRLRRELGTDVSFDEYPTRFPSLQDALRSRLEVATETVVGGGASSQPPAASKPRACTTEDLVRQLTDMALLSGDQRQKLAGLRGQFADAASLAAELQRRGWLTPFQVSVLLDGKGAVLRLGAYIVLDRLGEGGMGQVVKARHQVMKRLVAVKMIRKGILAYGEQVQRFYREIEAVARLSHPNIVLAHDAGVVNEIHFFAMEYVEGIDLARKLRDEGPMPIDRACEYVRQAALGLQHAHERGLVHRDIKPSNLLLCKGENGDEIVKILDLGLARIHAANNKSRLTQVGEVMGTVDYIAPEQATDASTVDIRADLYSLGCTLFHLIAGQPVFVGGSMAEKLLRHRRDEPKRLGMLRDLPAGLDQLVAKLLAKRPEDRYQTPREVAEALAPFCRVASPVPTQQVPSADTSNEPTVAYRPEPAAMADALPLAQRLATVVPVDAKRRRRMRWMLVGAPTLAFAGLIILLILLRGSGGDPESNKPHIVIDPSAKKPLDFGPSVMARFDLGFLHALHRSKIPKEDQFEWQHEDLVAILGQHRVRGGIAAISPDTKLIAAIDGDKVRVGDSANLRARWNFPLDVEPSALAISNDQILAIGSTKDKTVRLWNGRTGDEIDKLAGHDDVPRFLVFLENKRLLVGAGRTLWVWDLDKYKIVHKLNGHEGYITFLAASGDGKRALSVGSKEDGTLCFWDLEAGGRPLRALRRSMQDQAEITGAAMTHDGGKVAVGHVDCSIHLWDPLQMEEGGETRASTNPWRVKSIHALKTHPWPPGSLAFSRDGKRLAAIVRVDVNLFNLEDGGSRRQIDNERFSPPGIVAYLAEGPKPRLLVAGQNMRLYDEETLDNVLPSTGLYDVAQCVALSPDGRYVAAGGAAASGSWVWDLATGKGSQRESRNQLLTVGFAPDGTKMFQAGQDYEFPRFTEVTQPPAYPELKKTSVTFISGAAMTPDGRFLLASNFHKEEVVLWDLRTGDAVRQFKLKAVSPQVQVSPNGHMMLTTGHPNQLWDLDTGEQLHSWTAPAYFLPKDRILVLDGAAARVYAVKGTTVQADEELPLLNTKHLVNCVVSQDGTRLVGVGGGKIQVLDVASGAEVWNWHRSWWPFGMRAFQLSPNGRYLITANSDGTVYVLRLPAGKG